MPSTAIDVASQERSSTGPTSGPSSDDGSGNKGFKRGRFTVSYAGPAGIDSQPGDDDVTDCDSLTTPDSASQCGPERPSGPEGAVVNNSVGDLLKWGKEIKKLFCMMQVQFQQVIQQQSAQSTSSSSSASVAGGGSAALPALPATMAPLGTAPHASLAQLQVPQSALPPASTSGIMNNSPAQLMRQSSMPSSVGGRSRRTSQLSGAEAIPGAGLPEAAAAKLGSDKKDEAINMWEALGKPIEKATRRNRQLEDENKRLKDEIKRRERELEELTAQNNRQEALSSASVLESTAIRDAFDHAALGRFQADGDEVWTQAGPVSIAHSRSLPQLLVPDESVAPESEPLPQPAHPLPSMPERLLQADPTLGSDPSYQATSPDVSGYGTREQYRIWREFKKQEVYPGH